MLGRDAGAGRETDLAGAFVSVPRCALAVMAERPSAINMEMNLKSVLSLLSSTIPVWKAWGAGDSATDHRSRDRIRLRSASRGPDRSFPFASARVRLAVAAMFRRAMDHWPDFAAHEDRCRSRRALPRAWAVRHVR